MSNKSTDNRTLQKAPPKTKASAPSSGGTSATGVVFDYCPTEFPETGELQPEKSLSQTPQAPEPPVLSVVTETPAPKDEPPREAPSPAAQAEEPKTEPVSAKPAAPEPAPLKFPVPPSPFGSGADLMAQTTAELSLRMFDIAQTNVSASFEFARRVAAARDLAEVLELQTAYLQQQFAAVTAQTEEMADFARKLSSIQMLGDLGSRSKSACG